MTLFAHKAGAALATLAAFVLAWPASAQTYSYASFSYAPLNDPAGTGSTFVEGINDSNQSVGTYTDSEGVTSQGFSYTASGGFTDISDPLAVYGTLADGINNAGQIVGAYGDGTGEHGFLETPGTGFTTLDDPAVPGGNTYAQGINSSDQIVGSYTDANYGTDPGSTRHGFLDTPGGGFTTLDDPNATNGKNAFGINSSGTVVGDYQDAAGTHGFVFTPGGGFTTLNDPLAKGETIAYGINDAGQIVGRYFDGTGLYGFEDTNGVFTTLSAPNATDGTSALGINNTGTIVGYYGGGSIGDYFSSGFVATPAAVPEASSMASFGLLGGGLLLWGKLRRVKTRLQA